MRTTLQHIDDEIDLRKLVASLKRRSRWLFEMLTISGLPIAGAVALKQSAQGMR